MYGKNANYSTLENESLSIPGTTKYDFRSDTATVPTPEMRKVMAEAEVGDDLLGEDPTVIRLQNKVAKLCGKEAALYVPSGTMSNQIAILTHVLHHFGNKEVIFPQVICDYRSHVYRYECGGLAFHSRTSVKPIHPQNEKYITASEIEKNLHLVNDFHSPITSIISLENTLNGDIFPIEEIQKIRKLVDQHQLVMHLDGARLWNASVETGISLEEYGKYFESISLCLSKGLGAPIGSVLVGSKAFISKAVQIRKLFGGAWRQAGILAAAGIDIIIILFLWII